MILNLLYYKAINLSHILPISYSIDGTFTISLCMRVTCLCLIPTLRRSARSLDLIFPRYHAPVPRIHVRPFHFALLIQCGPTANFFRKKAFKLTLHVHVAVPLIHDCVPRFIHFASKRVHGTLTFPYTCTVSRPRTIRRIFICTCSSCICISPHSASPANLRQPCSITTPPAPAGRPSWRPARGGARRPAGPAPTAAPASAVVIELGLGFKTRSRGARRRQPARAPRHKPEAGPRDVARE